MALELPPALEDDEGKQIHGYSPVRGQSRSALGARYDPLSVRSDDCEVEDDDEQHWLINNQVVNSAHFILKMVQKNKSLDAFGKLIGDTIARYGKTYHPDGPPIVHSIIPLKQLKEGELARYFDDDKLKKFRASGQCEIKIESGALGKCWNRYINRSIKLRLGYKGMKYAINKDNQAVLCGIRNCGEPRKDEVIIILIMRLS